MSMALRVANADHLGGIKLRPGVAGAIATSTGSALLHFSSPLWSVLEAQLTQGLDVDLRFKERCGQRCLSQKGRKNKIRQCNQRKRFLTVRRRKVELEGADVNISRLSTLHRWLQIMGATM